MTRVTRQLNVGTATALLELRIRAWDGNADRARPGDMMGDTPPAEQAEELGEGRAGRGA